MGFVFDTITQEDVKKYDILADYRLSRPYQFSGEWLNLKINPKAEQQWVVDRAEDVYLRFGGWANLTGGKINHEYYLFYYKGARCYMELESVYQKDFGTVCVKSFEVMNRSKVHILLLGDVADIFKAALKHYLCASALYSSVSGLLDVVFMPDCMRGVQSDLRVY